MKKIILLNAPPGAGKDLAAMYLCQALNGTHQQFKESLYEATHEHYGLKEAGLDYDVYTNRERKDKPMLIFGHISPRQALIHISEDVIKPIKGKAYLGQMAAQRLQDGWNVFSDSGFYEEALPLVQAVGAENLYIIQFSREGCSFEGDSRKYIDIPPGCHHLVTLNNGLIQDLIIDILSFVKKH